MEKPSNSLNLLKHGNPSVHALAFDACRCIKKCLAFFLILFLILRRYKKPDGSTKSRQSSADLGTRKGSQKNTGIGFDTRAFKGKSKVRN